MADYSVGTQRKRLKRTIPPDIGLKFAAPIPKLKDPTEAFLEKFELPRQHYMPVDGVPYDKNGSISVTAQMALTEVVNLTLPAGYEGVVKLVGQGADFPGLFDDTTWQLLVNGRPYFDWGNVTFQRGTIQSPTPTTILLTTGAIVSLQISNPSTNTYTAYGRLVGWGWVQKDVRYSTLE